MIKEYNPNEYLPPLSPRMQLIAKMVTKGNRLADIGCDHGYLSIFLAKTGICPSCIAADINKKPLEAAASNIKLYNCEKVVTTRLSNGLAAFKAGEADTVMICGMGGKLMRRILLDGKDALIGVKELILEPQSDPAALRSWLYENNYEITLEGFVTEQGKYYPVIKAIPSAQPHSLSEVQYEFGPVLLQKKDPLLFEYLGKQKEQLEKIYEGLADKLSSGTTLLAKLTLIKDALEFFK